MYLESSWTPINKLNWSFSLNGSDSSIDIFWYNVTSVQHTAGHVLSMTRIAFHHLVCWLKTSIGDFSNTQLFMVCFLSRNNWSVGHKRKVNSWVWYQIGLEFSKINVQSTIKSKRSGNGWDDLTNKPVKIGVGGAFDIEITTANIVNCLRLTLETKLQ